MQNAFEALPDFVNLLLAGLGVFLGVWPEAPRKMKRYFVLRASLVLLLLLLVALALRSSHLQRKESKGNLARLQASADALSSTVSSLQKTVNTYGPRLDAIMADPKSSSGQRIAAQALKDNIIQNSQESACSNINVGGDAVIRCLPSGDKK